MQFGSVPAELKSLRQWVVWRSVVATDGKITKPPFNPAYPAAFADIMAPETWGTFDQAIAALDDERNNLQGIGFVFTEQDEYFGIDIDDESKVKPEHLAMRRSAVTDILTRAHTYTEVSPSGMGLHIIAKGRMIGAGRRSSALQIEVYSAQRYFTVTGNVFDKRTEITNQQGLLDDIVSGMATTEAKPGSLGDVGGLRSLDLSDEEVINRAYAANPRFAARFNAQVDCGPGDWSETFMMIIGVLDQITGRVDQIQRIIMASPMVKQAPPSRAGETREAKALRNFQHVLSRVRNNNSGFMASVAHGRAIIEAMDRKKAEDAKKRAEEILSRFEEGFSKHSLDIMKAFPLEPHYLDLTPPPGFTGRYVEAAMKAMHHPYLKFMLPATLATLAGVVARKYKLPDGSGTTLNFILSAPSATGKTQTMNVWRNFITRAAYQVGRDITGNITKRILMSSTSSAQALFADFAEMPGGVWYVEECASQLDKLTKPQSNTDNQLKDSINEMFDASKVNRLSQAPRSIANRKAEIHPIPNLSISTYWTTTNSKFDLFSSDAEDGFLSRITIVRHDGPAGDLVSAWEIERLLPDDLHNGLVTLLSIAKKFDEDCKLDPNEAAANIVTVDTTGISQTADAFSKIADKIKRAALSGELPKAYVAVARLDMIALRLAGLLAIMDNPYVPVVEDHHYKWAFGYLLQSLASMLSDMDRGDLGATMSDDIKVVIYQMQRIMKKNKESFVRMSELTDYLRRVAPFSQTKTMRPGAFVKQTLDEMELAGTIRSVHLQQDKQGTNPKVYYLIGDK